MTVPPGIEFLVLLPVFAGALSQRVTGLGFALVASPFVVLLFGPEAGVLLVNSCGLVVSTTGAISDRRHAEGHRLRVLVPAGVVGAVLGVVLTGLLARAVLEVVIGSLLLLGLVVTILLRPTRVAPASWSTGVLAGASAGAAAGLAGLSGPPLVIYAKLTGWSGRGMAASFQFIFAAMAATAVAAKLIGGSGLPATNGWFWPALIVVLALGMIVGHRAAAVIPARAAWVSVIVISLLGSVATIVHGALTLGSPG